MRAQARWGLVVVAVVAMLAALGAGPRSTETVKATQPDVYQASAGSSALNVMGFQTGSPVDPAPAVNTAFPLTSISADNGPSTLAHAAFVEPPTTAQAATGLNNVPVPYASQADAQCNACSDPRTADADGTADQKLNGGRVEISGGKAHAQANLYEALATASNGEQTVAPFDQVTTLFDALVNDVYIQVINKPGNAPPPSQLAAPPCTGPVTAPGPLATPLSTFSTECANDLPLHSLLVKASASDSTTQVTTDVNGTVVDAASQVNGAQLLDGLISIGSIHAAVHAAGDGTAAGTHLKTTNDVETICVAGDCSDRWSITAAGICTQAESHSVPLCTDDPLNQSLQQHGFDVCRLGSATSQSGTDATASVSGVLVEFHAVGGNGSYAPDPGYFKSGTLCQSTPPSPKPNWSGISFYAIVANSSLQLHTDLFPSFAPQVEAIGGASMPSLPDQGGSSTTTTIVNNVNGGGAYPQATKVPPARLPSFAVVYSKGNDRRPLLLTVFGLLELILLSNLTAMARARRRLAS